MDKLNAAEFMAASDYVATWAKKNEAITNLAALLGRIGSVVQAADEAEKHRDMLLGEAEKASGALAALRSEVTQADAARDKILSTARAEADKIAHEAKERAAVVVNTANAQAAETIKKAEDRAARVLATSEVDVQNKKNELVKVQASLEATAKQNAAAEQKLKAANAKIEEMRANMAKALG